MELSKKRRAARGVRHVLDVATPTLMFLLGYRIAGVGMGVVSALVAAGVIAAVRVARGDSLRMVRLSLVMVFLHSVAVTISGQGRDFFMPEILLNAVLALAFGVSLLRGKPLSVPLARRLGMSGSDDPRLSQEHTKISWMWFGLWCSHLIVLVPLYLSSQVAALGLVSTVFNKPSVVVMLFVSWRRLRAITEQAAPTSPAGLAGSPHSPAQK